MATSKSIFQTNLIRDFPIKSENIEIIKSNVPLHQAFQTLLKRNIISAPVFDVEKKNFVGFLDLRDLVPFVVSVYDEDPNATLNLEKILSKGSRVHNISEKEYHSIFLARKYPFKPVYEKDNLWKAVEIIASGTRNVPVLNERGDLVNIISQTSFLEYLNENRERFESFSKPISELPIGTNEIFKVPKDIKAIEVFRKMAEKELSSLALEEKNGKIIGYTSSRDLKMFFKNPKMELLKKPILEFLDNIRTEKLNFVSPIQDSTDLGTAISRMAELKAHRIFVADKNGVPYKVLSLKDILHFFLKTLHPA